MKTKQKKVKQPSLLRQLLTIYHEQALRRKALRYLAKQTWSVDFLSLLMVRSARLLGNGVILEIENRDGQKIRMTYDKAKQSHYDQIDDNIFNHLDDDIAVADFIRRNSVR